MLDTLRLELASTIELLTPVPAEWGHRRLTLQVHTAILAWKTRDSAFLGAQGSKPQATANATARNESEETAFQCRIFKPSLCFNIHS